MASDGPAEVGFSTISNAFYGANSGGAVFGALYNLNTFLDELKKLIGGIQPPVINPVFPVGPAAPAIAVPPPPAVDPIVYVAPAPPAPFTGSLNITDLFPPFDIVAPNLIFPAPPTPPTGTVPASPPINLNFVYPDLNFTLPAPPNLLSIQTVNFNGVTFPVIDPTLPVLTAVAPSATPWIQGLPYTDALLAVVKADLQNRITAGTADTGLPGNIETNLWNRAKERELIDLQDAILDLDRMEAMGFAFAPGVLIDTRTKLRTEFGYKSAGLSRDIAWKQAELHLTNIHKALELTVMLEDHILVYQSAYEQKSFEATKYLTEATIQIYNAAVQAYDVVVKGYIARIQIYAEQIKLALAQVDVYKVQIEAEKVKAEINTALVAQFDVLTRAALASVEVYKTQIEAIKVKAEVEKLKVEVYGEQIKAFLAGVNVYTAQIEGYKAAVSAEGTKETVYKDQVDAFSSRIGAVAKTIDAKVAVYKGQIDGKTLEYEGYKALIQGQAEQVKAISMKNDTAARIYEAIVRGTTGFNDSLVKEWQVIIDEAIQVTQIGLKAAEASSTAYLQTKQIAVEAAKAGAQVESQIAAADIGRVTFSTHRSGTANLSEQASQSDSTSNQFSVSTSHSEIHNTAD
jgi:hypothetical protein